MSSSGAQSSAQNPAMAGSSASSIKLVQQQVQGFIQGLNNEELTKLLEIFEKSLLTPGSVVKSCKMVQYKCYESKIDLNGKVGCGFGRSEEEAVAISIKDFFEILLQEEKYLYLVKECFRQMKGQTQNTQGGQTTTTTTATTGTIQSQNLLNTSQKNQTLTKNNSKKSEETENSPTERKLPIIQNQIIQDIDEQESNPSDNNPDYQIVDNQMSMIEMQINESNVYELSKKIGNISVINGPNIVASTNFNNNSQQDIDEMLLKIMFEEEKKQQQQQQGHQHPQLQGSSNQDQINFNQYMNSLQNSLQNPQLSQQPLTQFQIYQMQYLQQQQQQQQLNKQQGPQQQLQQLQQHIFQQQSNQQGSYFQSYMNNIQFSNNNISNANTNLNNIEQDIPEVKYDNLSTPPNKNKRSSFSNNNRGQQLQQINQQLNDTAFMPIKNTHGSSNNNNNNNQTNNIPNQQKLIRNNSIQNHSHQSSQQQQSSHQSSQQQSHNNFAQNSVQSSTNINTQNSFNVYANKENSYQHQNNNSLSGLGSKINNLMNNNNSTQNFHQSQQNNHQNSKNNLHQQSTSSTCCNHKEELEREHTKVENLEKKIKLLMEENKILKSLLLDNQAASTSQTLKNKISSNQTPRGQQYQPANNNNGSITTSQQEPIDNKYINNSNIPNNNINNSSNSKNPYRNNQINMRSQSQDPSSKYQNSNNQIITLTQYSSGQKKNTNISDTKNNYQYGSSGKYANDDLNCSHLSLNNSSQLNQSSVKKTIPKLNLEVLPNYHGKFNKSQNNQLLQDYNSKYSYKKRF